jgi:RNA polymerase sigma-70 factor, ECF subfamily
MAQPVTSPQDDASLVAGWRRGDEAAAAELMRRHARALAAFLSAHGGQMGDDLEDLVQEAFFRAFRRIGQFSGRSSFRTWLFTIGRNALRDAGRRTRRREVVPLNEDLEAGGGDPHQIAEAAEAEGRIGAALERLPRMQREVFLLRAQQGLEYGEIALALDTSEGAARVHYHHAVKRLKKSLEDA